MTTHNKNDDFIFDSFTKTAEKSDKHSMDDFDFGDLSWPAETPDQAVSDDFSFDELPELVEQPDRGVAELSPAEPTVQELLPFTCLKCAATNEVGIYQISDDGFTTKCFSCKNSIEIVRDSYAKRAGQLSRELFCVKCGHALGHHMVCRSCGLLFPDYFVVVNHAEARRQAKSRRSARFRQVFTDFWASLKPGPSKDKQDVYAPARAAGIAARKPSALSRGGLRKALAGVLIVVIVAAGGLFYYRQYEAEQKYAKDYVKALYGIKVAEEESLKACARISEDWKATAASSVNFVPRINLDADVKAQKIKAVVDKTMQQLQNPPAKYAEANAKLVALNGIYARLYALKGAPKGTLDGFQSAAAKADNAFKQATSELKASMPEKLSKELDTAKLRYSGLAGL